MRPLQFITFLRVAALLVTGFQVVKADSGKGGFENHFTSAALVSRTQGLSLPFRLAASIGIRHCST